MSGKKKKRKAHSIITKKKKKKMKHALRFQFKCTTALPVSMAFLGG